MIAGEESLDYCWVPETECQANESTNQSKQCGVTVDRFLRLQGRCSSRVCSNNSDVKVGVMRCSLDAVRMNITASADQQLEKDHASAHSAQHGQQLLAKHNIRHVRKPSYSADFDPCDFFFLPRIKSYLKERRLQDVEEIQQNATRQLLAIPQKREILRSMETRPDEVYSFRKGRLRGD